MSMGLPTAVVRASNDTESWRRGKNWIFLELGGWEARPRGQRSAVGGAGAMLRHNGGHPCFFLAECASFELCSSLYQWKGTPQAESHAAHYCLYCPLGWHQPVSRRPRRRAVH